MPHFISVSAAVAVTKESWNRAFLLKPKLKLSIMLPLNLCTGWLCGGVFSTRILQAHFVSRLPLKAFELMVFHKHMYRFIKKLWCSFVRGICWSQGVILVNVVGSVEQVGQTGWPSQWPGLHTWAFPLRGGGGREVHLPSPIPRLRSRLQRAFVSQLK